MLNKANKMRFTLLAIALLVVIMTIVLLGWLFNKGVGVEIAVAPKGSTVFVNGKKERVGSGTIKLDPGTYKITATHEGFEPSEKTIEVNENSDTITLLLSPNTTEAVEYTRKNQVEFLAVESKVGEKTGNEGAQLQAAFPLVEKLPFRGLLFNIDYKQPSANNILIQITATSPLERSYAIKQIENWGFSPADYDIEFADLTENPFKETRDE